MNIKELFISSLLLSGTALAAPANKDTLFYCQFNNGKQVRIEQHGDKIRYRFGKNLARPELAFEQPKDQVFLNRLTPLLDNDRRGEIIEIYIGSYMVTATTISGRTVYRLSFKHSGTEHEITCKKRSVFLNRDMALELPDLPNTLTY